MSSLSPNLPAIRQSTLPSTLPSVRRDPAPSRLRYRWQRLWLTPAFRVGLRYGLPLLIVAAAVGGYLSSESRRAALVADVQAVRTAFENRPEFQVSLISISGAPPALADAVRARMGIRLPVSSWDLDLDKARAAAEGLDAVKSAELRVVGNELDVRITQRRPALVWRNDKGLALIDATGHPVAGLAARGDRPDLPLVTGLDADKAVGEALQIFQAARPFGARVRGLVRQGARRWDLVLSHGLVVKLPAIDPLSAMEQLLALDQAEHLLSRDLTVIDLRDPRRPVLRLAPDALAAFRNAP